MKTLNGKDESNLRSDVLHPSSPVSSDKRQGEGPDSFSGASPVFEWVTWLGLVWTLCHLCSAPHLSPVVSWSLNAKSDLGLKESNVHDNLTNCPR